MCQNIFKNPDELMQQRTKAVLKARGEIPKKGAPQWPMSGFSPLHSTQAQNTDTTIDTGSHSYSNVRQVKCLGNPLITA